MTWRLRTVVLRKCPTPCSVPDLSVLDLGVSDRIRGQVSWRKDPCTTRASIRSSDDPIFLPQRGLPAATYSVNCSWGKVNTQVLGGLLDIGSQLTPFTGVGALGTR